MHNKFTIVSRVRRGQQGEVRAKLENHAFIAPGTGPDPFGFSALEDLHFASLSMYDDPEDGWSLVFEHNVDGEIDAYLRKLIDTADTLDKGAFLLGLYAHCVDFSGDDLDQLRRCMKKRIVLPQAGFLSPVGMTRDQIRLDAQVYEVVDSTLGTAGVPVAPKDAQAFVLAALDKAPETKEIWHQMKDDGTKLGIGGKIGAILMLLLNGFGFLVLALWNLVRERTARMDDAHPDQDLRRSLELGEDFIPTNHMISVVYVHEDAGRQMAKRTAFGLLRGLVTLLFRNSFLGSINTIHFAHWSFVNNNRRLLFVSNYDGSWRSYLDDFTLKASNGLNLAWGHSTGFPKTWFMLWGGASMGPQFIDYARRSMVPTLVWYSAYPSVSVTNINRNRKLRAALQQARKGRGDTTWLELV